MSSYSNKTAIILIHTDVYYNADKKNPICRMTQWKVIPYCTRFMQQICWGFVSSRMWCYRWVFSDVMTDHIVFIFRGLSSPKQWAIWPLNIKASWSFRTLRTTHQWQRTMSLKTWILIYWWSKEKFLSTLVTTFKEHCGYVKCMEIIAEWCAFCLSNGNLEQGTTQK